MDPCSNRHELIIVDEINVGNGVTATDDSSSTSSSYFLIVLNGETSTIKAYFD